MVSYFSAFVIKYINIYVSYELFTHNTYISNTFHHYSDEDCVWMGVCGCISQCAPCTLFSMYFINVRLFVHSHNSRQIIIFFGVSVVLCCLLSCIIIINIIVCWVATMRITFSFLATILALLLLALLVYVFEKGCRIAQPHTDRQRLNKARLYVCASR